MKTAIAALLFVLSSTAWAHGNVECPKHPKEEWRSHEELQRKLEKEGWTVRRMELTPTCYEVYAKTPQGDRIEAFFDPKTFERVED
ncbi:MAG: PepSY domain-containing protein [Proteobacteria bacterium]|uniref:PepSY domain-containing protein n=1 Tax=Rudaea sp. TaxID=2136325 RepID=UPI00321FE691|nr:PepSY domain-containing protein [Pseudomonadota bacterium]